MSKCYLCPDFCDGSFCLKSGSILNKEDLRNLKLRNFDVIQTLLTAKIPLENGDFFLDLKHFCFLRGVICFC